VIITVAGNGVQGYSGDNGMATSARLNYPFGVAVDACGNLLIADTDNNVIRRVATNGVIITVVGNHSYGHSGDGAAATSASLANPSNIAVDHAGNLFIADTGNNVIREVGLGGTIATLAGNGVAGYSGDASVATNASLGNPSGVAVDPYGNLFLADNANNVIREVNTGYGRQFILTLNNVTTNQAGVYSVIVTNAGGIVSSTNAVLTVQPSTNQTTSTN
jgi:secreted PhoX family phosphatase